MLASSGLHILLVDFYPQVRCWWYCSDTEWLWDPKGIKYWHTAWKCVQQNHIPPKAALHAEPFYVLAIVAYRLRVKKAAAIPAHFGVLLYTFLAGEWCAQVQLLPFLLCVRYFRCDVFTRKQLRKKAVRKQPRMWCETFLSLSIVIQRK